MDQTHDEAEALARAEAAEAFACPVCAAPAGNPCRTRSGTTARSYHTPRFILVPALGQLGEVLVPGARGPGRAWTMRPPTEVRIGYAYSSGPADDPVDQSAELRAAGCARTYLDVVAIAVKARPALDQAIRMGADQRAGARDQPVTLVAHELSRLARNTPELIRVVGALQAAGLRLELRTGELAGVHDPDGDGLTLFAMMAAAARLDRDHLTRRSQAAARAAADRGVVGGRPRVLDDDMLRLARALRDEGVPVPEIARRLTVAAGRNAGGHPSVASVYRALAQPPAPQQLPTTERTVIDHGMD